MRTKSIDELDELLDTAANYDLKQDMTVRTLAYTGLRANEFAHLKSDWIDWQNEHVRVPPEEDGWTPKNSNAVRTIPVRDPEGLRVLREFLKRNDGVGVTRKAIHDRVTKIAKKTDIRKKVTPPRAPAHLRDDDRPERRVTAVYASDDGPRRFIECEHLPPVHRPAT